MDEVRGVAVGISVNYCVLMDKNRLPLPSIFVKILTNFQEQLPYIVEVLLFVTSRLAFVILLDNSTGGRLVCSMESETE